MHSADVGAALRPKGAAVIQQHTSAGRNKKLGLWVILQNGSEANRRRYTGNNKKSPEQIDSRQWLAGLCKCSNKTRMAYNKKGYFIRARMIQRIVEQNYEKENQAKCLKSVWRHFVYPQWGIGYRSFLKYTKVEPPKETKSENQLKLF